MKYLNSFYNPNYQGSTQHIECNNKPILYKNYSIYYRIKSTIKSARVFDIVKNGVCIGMHAGLNGAKNRIDQILERE